MPSKRLFLFCDDPGEDAGTSPETLAGYGGGHGAPYVTNVLRLSRAIKPYSDDSKLQIVFYQSDVGSEANCGGEFVTKDSRLLEAQGMAFARKVREAYTFVAQNFELGDEIFLFGFSRGAYTARIVAEIIDKIGLLEIEMMGNFFTILKALVDGEQPDIPPRTRRTTIRGVDLSYSVCMYNVRLLYRCVGLWDTIGAVYNVINGVAIGDTTLPVCINVALHAVSLQENRKEFAPIRWTPPERGLNMNQVFKEVWFPGSHNDLGGSYARHELADIALFWMTGELLALSLCSIDTDFIKRSRQLIPDNWGTSQPHNAYNQTPFYLKKSGQCPKSFGQPERFREAMQETLETRLNDGPILYDSISHMSPIQPVEWVSSESVTTTQLEKCIRGDPGKVPMDWSGIWFGHGGREFDLPQYELLVAERSALQWMRVEGEFSPNKVADLLPVRGGNEPDGTTLFIVQGFYDNDVHIGRTKVGELGVIPICGKEVSLRVYNVLVLRSTLYSFHNTVDHYATCLGQWTVKPGGKNAQEVSITPEAPSPPRIVAGLNLIDLSNRYYRITSYVDNISTSQYTAHIDTWCTDSTLYNARISCLKLAAADPDFQCANCRCRTVRF
ncbi:hypothetical protein A0H81_13789 [Grifola frondosa]|uniref:DUF2235 domain-containing protein n=1 Tax=Grifola frondosa TaxID=5627 RepID=A0A1C7LP73_GRIFR|nr:hypothetical protein A0H81_13789 [Grifola frondosa]